MGEKAAVVAAAADFEKLRSTVSLLDIDPINSMTPRKAAAATPGRQRGPSLSLSSRRGRPPLNEQTTPRTPLVAKDLDKSGGSGRSLGTGEGAGGDADGAESIEGHLRSLDEKLKQLELEERGLGDRFMARVSAHDTTLETVHDSMQGLVFVNQSSITRMHGMIGESETGIDNLVLALKEAQAEIESKAAECDRYKEELAEARRLLEEQPAPAAPLRASLIVSPEKLAKSEREVEEMRQRVSRLEASLLSAESALAETAPQLSASRETVEDMEVTLETNLKVCVSPSCL